MAAVTSAIALGAAAAGTAISANQGRKAADKSRREGRRATGEQLSAEERQFETARADQAPFLQAGVDATNQQRILLGLGASDVDADRRQGIQDEIAGLTDQVWDPTGEKTAQIQLWKERGGSTGRKNARRLEGDRNAFNSEFSQLQRSNQIQALEKELGGLAPVDQRSAQDQQKQAFQNFVESPGQKFIRDRAQRSLTRNSSAIGGLGGGNVRSALVEQGAGFAQQDFQNQFGRLGQLAGQGQASAQSLGSLGSASIGRQGQLTSNQISRSSGLRQDAANSRAEGIAGLVQLGGQFDGQFSNPGRVNHADGVQGPQPR